MKMLRKNIQLTPEQVAKLKAESRRTGAPVAEIIRRALDEYLAKRLL